MALEDKIPGITFFMSSEKLSQAQGLNGGYIVTVELSGEIHHEDIWKTVRSQLSNGLRVFGDNDLKGEILRVYKSEVARLEEELRLQVIRNEQLQRQLASYGELKEVFKEFEKQLK
jgi:uncharacterized NAD-dependent epimerase/dehydratase family protein